MFVSRRDAIVASDVSCLANYKEGPWDFSGSRSHEFQILNQEAMRFRLQPVKVASRLTYQATILEHSGEPMARIPNLR